jgi:hypothetical protein
MNTTNPPDTTLPDVPLLNLKDIREALKAHGVTLVDAIYEVECKCDICGTRWSEESCLQFRLPATWWHCRKCHPEEGDR